MGYDIEGTDEDDSNKNQERLLTPELSRQERQPPSLSFGRDSEARRGVGKLHSERRKGFGYDWVGGC